MSDQDRQRDWHSCSQHSGSFDIEAAQRDRLRRTIYWATWAREALAPLAQEYIGRVHFRPSSTGVSVVGLSPDGPQLGDRIGKHLTCPRESIEEALARKPGRTTPEKRLQSLLIASAYRRERRIEPLSAAATSAGQSAELIFVTDELFLPMDGSPGYGKGCDLLGIRRVSPSAFVPAQIELKSFRDTKELFIELDRYAPLINLYANLFEELFSAVLGQSVRFAGAAERWAVWPAASGEPDRQRTAFAGHGFRLFTYNERTPGPFEFRPEN